MKTHTPQISWHDRQPILSVDIQNRFHSIEDNIKYYRLATGGNDSHVIIWKVAIENMSSNKPIGNIECLAELTKHQRSVNVVRFSPNLDDNFLASGDDDSLIIIWKLVDNEILPSKIKPVENKNLEKKSNIDSFIDSDIISIETWKMHKTLRGHNQDVSDLCWSKDGQFLVSGSVDNNVFVWDTYKGIKLNRICKEHNSYVQGVAWDPLNKYIASLSTDRNMIISNCKNGKTIHKIFKTNFEENDYLPTTSKLFYDQTLMSFFRRLTFSPGGELLLVPSGILELKNDKFENVVYVFERKSLNRPSFYLLTNKCSVAIKCCPTLFQLNDNEENIFNIPYRIIFAVATQDSILFYDSQQLFPFAYASQLHYLRLTDISWSPDGRMLIITSTDGFSSFIIFDENELGMPYEGKLMEFNEIETSNVKTPNKINNQCNGNQLSKSSEKETKATINSSTPITSFFRKIPNDSKINDKNEKANVNSKPGRRISLITIFDPHKSKNSNDNDEQTLTGLKRKQSDTNNDDKINS